MPAPRKHGSQGQGGAGGTAPALTSLCQPCPAGMKMPSPSISQTRGRGQTGDAFQRQAGRGTLFPTPSHCVVQRPKFSQRLGGLGPPIWGPLLILSPPPSPCSSPSPSLAAPLPSLSSGQGSWRFSHQYLHLISHCIPPGLSKDPSPHHPPAPGKAGARLKELPGPYCLCMAAALWNRPTQTARLWPPLSPLPSRYRGSCQNTAHMPRRGRCCSPSRHLPWSSERFCPWRKCMFGTFLARREAARPSPSCLGGKRGRARVSANTIPGCGRSAASKSGPFSLAPVGWCLGCCTLTRALCYDKSRVPARERPWKGRKDDQGVEASVARGKLSERGLLASRAAGAVCVLSA